MKLKIEIILFVTSCILFIPGFPMWLDGCNVDIYGGCLTRDVKNSIIIDTKIKTRINSANNNVYYIKIKYQYGLNSTCNQKGNDHLNIKEAEKDMEKYSIGLEKRIIIPKIRDNSCSDNIRHWRNIWYIGVSFLCAVALIDIIIIIIYVQKYYDKNRYTSI